MSSAGGGGTAGSPGNSRGDSRGDPGVDSSIARLILVSGLSGSGKSVALDMLEDLEFYCLDNIPARMVRLILDELMAADDPKFRHMAIGLDARPRPRDVAAIPPLIDELRQRGVSCDVVFLRAMDSVLLRRYSETRRRHPLTSDALGLQEAIARERELLAPVADLADLTVDTSETSVHELREIVRRRIAGRSDGDLSLMFQSFGFKRGLPRDADFVFDARVLPNPYWETSLREQTGRDPGVIDFLESHGEVHEFLRGIRSFLEAWIPRFRASNRSYLNVAIGCTGGRHRSVYLAERLAAAFRDTGTQVLVRHNTLGD